MSVGQLFVSFNGDEGRHHAPAGVTGIGQEVAHEVYAAALPGGIQDPVCGVLEAFMGKGDHQLDADARRAWSRRNSVQKVSAHAGPGR